MCTQHGNGLYFNFYFTLKAKNIKIQAKSGQLTVRNAAIIYANEVAGES